MYDVQDWAEVHRLFHREGLNKSQIAQRLGMSRTTVYGLLRRQSPPVYERRPVPSLLEEFRDEVRAMLRDDPDVAATVMLERLRRSGYEGGISILRDFARQVRPQFVAAAAFQRTRYVPGEIGQVDWWHLPVEVSVGKEARRGVFGLVVTLPYSAAHAVVFTLAKDVAASCAALLGCLGRLGGVPEQLVFDNDTSIVASRAGGSVRLQVEVAALFGQLAVKGVAAPPRTPEFKGQVERTIQYLETSFLPLREFASLADLESQHDRWAQQVACVACHEHGTSLRGVLPRAWDHLFASDGTSWGSPVSGRLTSSVRACRRVDGGGVAYREVTVIEIKEVLRLWLRGEMGLRPIAEAVGADRKTVRRYIDVAVEAGLVRGGGEGQLTDELLGQVVEAVRPERPRGHGAAWEACAGENQAGIVGLLEPERQRLQGRKKSGAGLATWGGRPMLALLAETAPHHRPAPRRMRFDAHTSRSVCSSAYSCVRFKALPGTRRPAPSSRTISPPGHSNAADLRAYVCDSPVTRRSATVTEGFWRAVLFVAGARRGRHPVLPWVEMAAPA